MKKKPPHKNIEATQQVDWSSPEFVTATVHELNNFLSAIRGFAELSMMDLEADSELANYLSEITFAVDRNSEFNQQLLMMSGVSKPTIENISSDFVGELLAEFNFEVLSEPEKYDGFNGNKKWLKKLLEAIQQFAFSVANKKSQLFPQLSISKQPPYMEFKFSINTQGQEVDLKQFFQPYYSSRELTSGKGLGLCWLPALMKHLEGKLQVAQLEQGEMTIVLQFKI